MQDTRLIQALAELADARTLIAEILDESPRDPHDVIALSAAQKFLNAAVKQIGAAVTVCPSRYGFSGRCNRPSGHPGSHRDERREWSDTEAATSHHAIVTAMKGRTE